MLMTILDSISGIFSSNFASIGSVLIVGVVAFVAIEIGARNRNLTYGGWGERRAIRNLGYTALGFATARWMYRGLRRGIKGTVRIGRYAKVMAKQGIGAANASAKATYALVKEEQFNVSEEMHQAAVAASSYEFAHLIKNFSKYEFHDHEAMKGLEYQINAFVGDLQNFSSLSEVDVQAKKYIKDSVGKGITTELLKLGENEKFEVNHRRKTFNEAAKLLKVAEEAENRARIIEQRAKAQEKKLEKLGKREFQALEKQLEKKGEEIKKAQKSSPGSLEPQSAAALAQARSLWLDISMRIKRNIETLRSAHAQLLDLDKRMIGTINMIRQDVMTATIELQKVKDMMKSVQKSEKEIDAEDKRLKRGTESAELHFNSLEYETPEEILINVAGDSAVILDLISGISIKIINVDEQKLIPLIDILDNALRTAYKAEEAARIGFEYYMRILAAHREFDELVKQAVEGASLNGEINIQSLMDQEELQEMSEKIAKIEMDVAQAEKSLFIKAIKTLEEARLIIHGHIGFLRNLVDYTIGTKSFLLKALTKAMEGMHMVKVGISQKFEKTAQIYQKRLEEAHRTQTIERLAA